MQVTLLKSKIHNAVVTDAKLHYVGSVTIDQNLMDACGMFPNEKVLIVNNRNGERIETYTIKGKRGSGIICLNGAAAHKFSKHDEVIIMAFAQYDLNQVFTRELLQPRVIFPCFDNTKYRDRKQVTIELMTKQYQWKKRFDSEYIEEIALQMAYTEEEIKQIIESQTWE